MSLPFYLPYNIVSIYGIGSSVSGSGIVQPANYLWGNVDAVSQYGIEWAAPGDSVLFKETNIECTEESPKISGEYSLRYMNIFTKATSMCSTVQIMQEEQNRFLILKYNVANLGELKFYLATRVPEDQ